MQAIALKPTARTDQNRSVDAQKSHASGIEGSVKVRFVVANAMYQETAYARALSRSADADTLNGVRRFMALST